MANNRFLGSSFRLGMAAFLVLWLAGCAQNMAVIETNISPHIRESADLIHQDLLKFNALKQVNVPPVPNYKSPDSGPLTTPITLKWAGKPDEAVKSIAYLIGFEFKSTGKLPVNPIHVRVDAINQPAFKVLEDIGLQMGRAAGVGILTSKSLLTVNYLDNERNTP